MVNFTHSIDVHRHPRTAEHGQAQTSTPFEASSVIVTEDWRHAAQPGFPTTRLQAKAVWGPRAS